MVSHSYDDDHRHGTTMIRGVFHFFESHDMKTLAVVLIVIFSILFRMLIGLHSYSGQADGPMYGDYEAQRHWMEITST